MKIDGLKKRNEIKKYYSSGFDFFFEKMGPRRAAFERTSVEVGQIYCSWQG